MKPLNLQKFVSTKFELIAILLLQLATLHAQIDNDVNTSKIAKNQDGHGVYSNYLTANIQHPITTFSSEYSVSEIQQILVLKVRKIPNKTRFFSQAISDVYSGIYNGALAYANGTSQLYLPDDYDEPEQIDPNAEAAKQAAFVCLLGLDKDGNEIKSGSPLYHQFKQVAFNALTMLKDNNYNKVYGGSDGKGYNTSRRVILFLQAYDFLKGLEPQNDTVIQIGYLLQSHVRDFFRINKNWPWDVFYRNDNHSLMFAGALGLASVVLHDHSHKSIDKSWHPEQWAHAALWRINRTLWHEEWGKKTESKRGGTYGFGEGYHYFGFSMIECVLPYMLALKNARSDEKLPIPDEFGYDYKPKNILPLTFYPKETVEINLWDDENYTNLFEWYSNSLKPNGYVQMTDDGFPYIGYRGIGIYRNKVNLHYPEEAFSRENFASEIIDVMVAQLEGHFNLYKETLNGHFISDNGEVAIHSYVDRGVEGQDPTNRQLLLHFNVKKDEFFKMYHRDFLGSPHGHYDLSSFTLNAGISNGASGVLATALIPEASSRVSLLKTRMIKPESHNVLLIDGEGPKIESPILVKKDLNDGLGNISYKFFYKNDIELVRQIRIFKDDGFITYEIRDELIGDNLADREVTWQMYTNGHSNGTANLNQTGFKGEFKLEEIADGQYLVNANCATYSDNSVLFNLGVDFDHNFAANQFEISLEDVTVGDEIDIIFHVEKIKFDVANSDDFVLHTTLTPHYCGESVRFPVSVTVTRGGEASAAVQANGNWKTFFSEQEENNGIIFNNPFYFTGFCDSLLTNAKYLRTSIDTSRFDSLLCTAFSPLVKVLMEEGTYLAIDTVEYLRSTSLLRNLHWFNLKKYYYNGNFITTQPFDTLTFYLPEVPPTYLSLMEEKSGLDYSYDTTTQKMTLYLADSGSYHFRFEPSNPCAVSCYYPPVEIVGHFEQVRSHERLGHILSVKADEGWLDMKEGARMNICTKAVLNNADSLTLSSVYGCPRTKSSGTDGLGKTKGFAAHYLNSEGHKYRSSYRVGSGAGLDHDGFSGNDMDKVKGPSNRSMIIVENEGALVLKSGSHTVVGNGSTILVKPGGTLKIENGATVVIGSHDSIGCGYGEIIVMDSAFLCVGSQANVSFYDNSPDTVDKHVLFVSMNPENGAINGIAPTSNAVDTAAECVAFCDFRTTFPEFGVGNYRHGWSNLGKPFAWMEEIGVICYGNDVYANGIYTLNETRYRFEICKYNKVTQQCMEAVDTIPMNDTDNYFGGRLQGRVNLSHLYQTYYPGKDFESGNDYRIRFIIHNDCGLSDEVVEIVEMPDPLTAVVTGDTVTCGGQGAITVNGSASTGEIDSLRWEVWAYKPFPELDSANYFANADTFVALIDTFWLDSVTIDTVVADTFWFYKSDTVDNDSFHYAKYYQQYWDTMIVSTGVGTFNFGRVFFHSGRKYQVLLTLFNPCGISTDSLIVRIKDGPTVSAGTDRYIPYGNPAGPHPVLQGSVGPTANSFSWSPSTGLSATNILAPTATPSSTVSYVLSAGDADGCTNYDTVLVYVNTVANAGRDTTICFDDSIQVGTAAVSGYDYLWSPAGLVSNPGIAQPYAFAPNEVNTLLLSVYQNGNLVGLDDMVLYRDSLDSITFAINPGGSPFSASFTVFHTPIDYTDIVWDFDDGTGTYSGNSVDFTYAFPNVPNGIYNVCAEFANACGTQNSCKDCEFDMLGTVMPKPPVPNSAAPINQPEHIWVWPNPFAHYTMLEYAIGQNDGAYVEITDLTGRVIRTIQVRGSAGQIKIDLGPRAVGVYHYRFVNANTEINRGKLVMIR